MQQVNPGFRHAVINGRTRNSLAISVIDSGGTTYAYFDNKNITDLKIGLNKEKSKTYFSFKIGLSLIKDTSTMSHFSSF